MPPYAWNSIVAPNADLAGTTMRSPEASCAIPDAQTASIRPMEAKIGFMADVLSFSNAGGWRRS